MKAVRLPRIRRILVALFSGSVLGFTLSGCMTIDDLSRESFRDSMVFSEGFVPSKIGMLPVIGIGDARPYLEEASDILGTSFSTARRDIEWVLPREGEQIIDDAGARGAFLEVMNLAKYDKVPKETDLRRIGEVLGTPYILVTTLKYSEISDGASHVILSSHFWDVDKGAILWEGTGEARGYVFLIFPVVPTSFEKAIRVASQGLIERFP